AVGLRPDRHLLRRPADRPGHDARAGGSLRRGHRARRGGDRAARRRRRQSRPGGPRGDPRRRRREVARPPQRPVGDRRPPGSRGDARPPRDPRRRDVHRARPDVRPRRAARAGRHLPSGRRSRDPRSREGRPMTAETPAVQTPAAPTAPTRDRRDAAIPSRRERSAPHAGWMVVAGKEFADHLWSSRFLALLVVLGLAALIPMYFAADTIRNAASQVTGASSIFLFLFTLGPKVGDTQVQLPAAWEFIAIVGPLLGIVFAFDAVNSERSEGTLPRLLSQP